MSSTNRAERIEQLFKALKKYYKPTNIATDRPVLDLLLYACCLEDAKFESADEAFAKLQQTYFDWNEVRVTTVAELAEVLGSLPNPSMAANRIKKCLQALFESRYGFDLEETRKANLGKTIQDFEAWNGITKFIVGFVVQNALGGHAIPIDGAAIEVLRMCEIVSGSDAEKGVVPGLDRSITKTKGPEFATLLHQFAADFKGNLKSADAIAVFKDLGVNPKPKPAPPPPPPPVKKAAPPAEPEVKHPVKGQAKAGASKGSDLKDSKKPLTAAEELEAKKASSKAPLEVKKHSKDAPVAKDTSAAKDAASTAKTSAATKVPVKPAVKEAPKSVDKKSIDRKEPPKKEPAKKELAKKEPPKKELSKKEPPKKEPPKKEFAKKELPGKSQPKKDNSKKAAPPPKKTSKPVESKASGKPKSDDKKITKKKPK